MNKEAQIHQIKAELALLEQDKQRILDNLEELAKPSIKEIKQRRAERSKLYKEILKKSTIVVGDSDFKLTVKFAIECGDVIDGERYDVERYLESIRATGSNKVAVALLNGFIECNNIEDVIASTKHSLFIELSDKIDLLDELIDTYNNNLSQS